MEHATRSPSDGQRGPDGRHAVPSAARTLVDNRPAVIAQRELAVDIIDSPRVLAQRLALRVADSPRVVAQRRRLEGMFGSARQRRSETVDVSSRPFDEQGGDPWAARTAHFKQTPPGSVAAPRPKGPEDNAPQAEAPTSATVQRQPEIPATEEALGESLVAGLRGVEGTPKGPHKGVHYAHNYEQKALRGKEEEQYKPYTDFWKDDYSSGYADPNYFDRTEHMTWRLKNGKSAVEAIRAWLAGPTIAECWTTLIAIETDTLRKAIGDANFEFRYGTLTTHSGTTPLQIGFPKPKSSVEDVLALGERAREVETRRKEGKKYRKRTVGTPGRRPLKKGEWVYFNNHPKYLLKHPGGAFQGENALYMGEDALKRQIFSGFGVGEKTEAQMMQTMVGAYDVDRTEADYRAIMKGIKKGRQKKGDKLETWKKTYERNKESVPDQYRDDKNMYPEKINDVQTLLDAPPAEVAGVWREGGLLPHSGKLLNPARVLVGLKSLTKSRLESRNYGAMSAMNLIDAAVEVAAMATDGPMSEITAEEQQTFAATIREKAEEKWPEIEKDAQSVIDIYNKIMPRRDSPLRSQIITSLKAVLDNLKVTVTVTLGKDFQYFNDSIVVEVASPRQRLVSAQKEMGKKGDTHTLAGPAGSLFDLTGLKVDSTLEIAVIDKGTFVDSRRRAVTVKQLVRNAQWGADDDQPYQVDLTID